MTADEVYVFTRLAADKVGATKMDRPEDVEPSPRTGRVYVALTNNTDRGEGRQGRADEANPRNANKHGQILELDRALRRPGGATASPGGCSWSAATRRTRPPTSRGFPKDQVSPISCPDNVAFDAHGNLWISTDGNALGSPRRPVRRGDRRANGAVRSSSS